MFKKKNIASLSIEVTDYVIRALAHKGSDIQSAQLIEIPLPVGTIQEGSITDEMAVFELIKEELSKVGKNRSVRLFTPDPTVLLKQIDHPDDVKSADLRKYVQMEIGHSFHLPFQDPLVDVFDPVEDDGKAMMFAAPPEEVNKWINILIDNQMKPEMVDVRALSNLRVLENLGMIDNTKTYLMASWSINSVVICIYSNGNIEFLRYQSIETDLNDWTLSPETNELMLEEEKEENYKLLLSDQIIEIDRMMNFFKFSLHKGEKEVNEIVVVGDNTHLCEITNMLSNSFSIPVHGLTDAKLAELYPGFKAKHSALIGLMMKGV